MKRISLFNRVSYVLLLLVSSIVMTNSMYAQNNQLDKKQIKEIQKDAKKRAKQWEKEGWRTNDTRSLEDCIIEHETRLKQNPNLERAQGEVSKCKSAKMCRRAATHSAQTEFANEYCGGLVGRSDDLGTLNESTGEESTTFITGFSKAMALNLTGLFRRSYEMEKDNGDGTKTYRIYFTVDRSKVMEAGKSALEKTLNEVELSTEIANKIRNYIESGVTPQ